jgi:hypothetical protein
VILHLVILDFERLRFLPSVERADTVKFLLIKVYNEAVETFLEKSLD